MHLGRAGMARGLLGVLLAEFTGQKVVVDVRDSLEEQAVEPAEQQAESQSSRAAMWDVVGSCTGNQG